MNTIQVTVKIESTLTSSSTQSKVYYLPFVWLLGSFTVIFPVVFGWVWIQINPTKMWRVVIGTVGVLAVLERVYNKSNRSWNDFGYVYTAHS